MPFNRVAVVGAGTIGVQVALTAAMYGHVVILKDVSEEKLGDARRRLVQDFRTAKLFPRQTANYNPEVLSRIDCRIDYRGFDNVDFVIDCSTEEIGIKKLLHLEMMQILSSGTVVAINTSCIPIATFSNIYKFPEVVVGCHFLNPVYSKDVAELIKGEYTSTIVLQQMKEFLNSVDVSPIIVRDSVGFVSNRLSHLLMNEAAKLVDLDVCGPEGIDLLFRRGFGHAMGPCETADLIGIDTVVHSLKILSQTFPNSNFESCELLLQMVSRGELGRKTGLGFYNY